MARIQATDPKLSVPVPDPIGRLYRQPGSDPLETYTDGSVRIPRAAGVLEKVNSGEWVPSITNVIGRVDKPYLVPWGAKMALEELAEIEAQHPGRFMANTSQAITYLKNAATRNRDASAVVGTRVHEACEHLALGQEPPHNLTEHEQAHVDAWKRWADDWQPEFLAVEGTVFGSTDDGLGYAGTGDFIARLSNGKVIAGDLKTTRSGLHNELALQLTAVTRADRMITPAGDQVTENIAVDAAIGVLLKPDGSYHVQQAQISDEQWEVFSGLRRAWNFAAFEGLTSSGPLLGRKTQRVEDLVF